MTKHIRIENADTASYKVVVRIYDKASGVPADPPDPINDRLVSEEVLHNPCQLSSQGTYLTSTRYVVVSEA